MKEKYSRSLFDEKNNMILIDILKKSFKFRKMISSHDSLYDEMNELYSEIESIVITTDFNERLTILINQFNNSKKDDNKLKGDRYNESDRLFGEYVINRRFPKDSPGALKNEIDFWNENQEELSKFRESQLINEIDIKMNNKLKKLIKLDKKILKYVNRIRDKYREKYHFIYNEIIIEGK